MVEATASESTAHPVTRMCLGCRRRSVARGASSDLIRLVVGCDDTGPVVVVDHRKTLPGRGAWLHMREDCVSAAVQRRALPKALRNGGLTVDPDALITQVINSAT